MQKQDPEITAKILQINDMVNFLVYEKKELNDKRIETALTNIFDHLIWVQKKHSQIMISIIDIKLMAFLVKEYENHIILLMKGFYLLFGNCKEKGQLAEHLVQEQIGDIIISKYLTGIQQQEDLDEEESLNMLASFLKAYHRHMNESNFMKFVKDGRCLLIEICCKFFNCIEEITKTSIMNILLTILQFPYAEKLIYNEDGELKESLRLWGKHLCELFRNQLKDFDQQLLVNSEEESQFMIHSINDKIIMWEDLSEIKFPIFREAFHEEVIIPLLIGALNTQGVPLFTLKFALFILTKLGKVLTNFGLVNHLGDLLFTNVEIQYFDNQLGTAILKAFQMKNLLSVDKDHIVLEEEVSSFSGINLFFLNILKSKDDRFLEMGCCLLTNLMSCVKKHPANSLYFVQKLGFGLNGPIVNLISEILINQFTVTHTIATFKNICALLIYIQPGKHLENDIKNYFIHVYKNQIKESIQMIQKNKESWQHIVEIFEYDVKLISMMNLKPEQRKDSALLFSNHISQDHNLTFYQSLPETGADHSRYYLVKALLLRRFSQEILDDVEESSIERYLERLKIQDAKYIKPGEFLKLPILVNSYRCKVVNEKDSKNLKEIPNWYHLLYCSLLLEDDNYIIIGFVNNDQIQIFFSIKFKHLQINLVNGTKAKTFIQFHVNKFDYAKEGLVQLSQMTIKNLEIGIEYFNVKKNKYIEKEMAQIMDFLKKSFNCVPEISLI